MATTIENVDSVDQLVSFFIGGEEFGVEILNVQEIIKPVQITRVPNAPAGVEGVINLRGRVLPVIDLRTRFGLPQRDTDKDTRIVVVELRTKVVGFLVDRVQEVIRLDPATFEPAPALATGVKAAFIRGVAKLEDRLLILVDLEKVLLEEDMGTTGAPAESKRISQA